MARRDDDVASVYEIRVSPGYLQLCDGRRQDGPGIVWETDRVAAFAILVTHGLCSIVTLCLLIR